MNEDRPEPGKDHMYSIGSLLSYLHESPVVAILHGRVSELGPIVVVAGKEIAASWVKESLPCPLGHLCTLCGRKLIDVSKLWIGRLAGVGGILAHGCLGLHALSRILTITVAGVARGIKVIDRER